MDEAEARSLLLRVLGGLRRTGYAELVSRYLDEQEVTEAEGESGTIYQIEVQGFWDDPRRRGGNLRIMASIDDGSFRRSLSPMTLSFIIAPDGSFVGE